MYYTEDTPEGTRVSILAQNPKRLEEAREAVHLTTSEEINVFNIDVRDTKAMSQAVEETGPIDVLVCNQGVLLPLELEKQELKEIKFMVDVNMMGTFHLIKAALPAMKWRTEETGLPASIALMSSQAGQVSMVKQHTLQANFLFEALVRRCSTRRARERRPELTNIIAGSSKGMEADDVAKASKNGIKSGRFIIPCNFEGTIIAIATCGLSPQSSFITTFIEVAIANFL
ncbi:3-dehydrosphinganine reductase [Dendrobium catenatum]|uniref:3-dehydrosphinganine reductase n=1 Tax=Dendrobium catenatum TaxID=906689 RepID=A0A2I0VIT7_9ASPA|nr:3-dehydrosphinganine reductase [Dendrobium catenatum]